MKIKILSAYFLLSTSALYAGGGPSVEEWQFNPSCSRNSGFAFSASIFRDQHSAATDLFHLSSTAKMADDLPALLTGSAKSSEFRRQFPKIKWNEMGVRNFLLQLQSRMQPSDKAHSGEYKSLPDLVRSFHELAQFARGHNGLIAEGEDGFVPFTDPQRKNLMIQAASLGTFCLALKATPISTLYSTLGVEEAQAADFYRKIYEFRQLEMEGVAETTVGFLRTIGTDDQAYGRMVRFIFNEAYLYKIALELELDPELALRSIQEFHRVCPAASGETKDQVRLYEALVRLKVHLSRSSPEEEITPSVEYLTDRLKNRAWSISTELLPSCYHVLRDYYRSQLATLVDPRERETVELCALQNATLGFEMLSWNLPNHYGKVAMKIQDLARQVVTHRDGIFTTEEEREKDRDRTKGQLSQDLFQLLVQQFIPSGTRSLDQVEVLRPLAEEYAQSMMDSQEYFGGEAFKSETMKFVSRFLQEIHRSQLLGSMLMNPNDSLAPHVDIFANEMMDLLTPLVQAHLAHFEDPTRTLNEEDLRKHHRSIPGPAFAIMRVLAYTSRKLILSDEHKRTIKKFLEAYRRVHRTIYFHHELEKKTYMG